MLAGRTAVARVRGRSPVGWSPVLVSRSSAPESRRRWSPTRAYSRRMPRPRTFMSNVFDWGKEVRPGVRRASDNVGLPAPRRGAAPHTGTAALERGSPNASANVRTPTTCSTSVWAEGTAPVHPSLHTGDLARGAHGCHEKGGGDPVSQPLPQAPGGPFAGSGLRSSAVAQALEDHRAELQEVAGEGRQDDQGDVEVPRLLTSRLLRGTGGKARRQVWRGLQARVHDLRHRRGTSLIAIPAGGVPAMALATGQRGLQARQLTRRSASPRDLRKA